MTETSELIKTISYDNLVIKVARFVENKKFENKELAILKILQTIVEECCHPDMPDYRFYAYDENAVKNIFKKSETLI